MHRLIMSVLSMISLLWTSAVPAEPRALSENELSITTAGLFDTIIVMPVVVIENQQQSIALNNGRGSASSNQEANIAVNNVINAQSINQGFESSTAIVVQMPLQSPSQSPNGVNFPTWVPWSMELIPFLLGRPCGGVC